MSRCRIEAGRRFPGASASVGGLFLCPMLYIEKVELPMSFSRIFLVSAIISLSGCSAGLHPGVEAMVAYPSEAERPAGESRIFFHGDGMTGGYVKEGTKVRIVSEESRGDDILVLVLDGEHQGKNGRIARKYLRMP